jgi:hypothetical protein
MQYNDATNEKCTTAKCVAAADSEVTETAWV